MSSAGRCGTLRSVTTLAADRPPGFFVPQRFATDPPGVLTRAYDPQTFQLGSLMRGRDPIDDQVIVALTRVRGSGSAVEDIGARFLDVGELTEGAASELAAEARFALRHLVARRDIDLTRATSAVFPELQAAEVVVEYLNLRTVDPEKFRRAIVPVVRRPEFLALLSAQRAA